MKIIKKIFIFSLCFLFFQRSAAVPIKVINANDATEFIVIDSEAAKILHTVLDLVDDQGIPPNNEIFIPFPPNILYLLKVYLETTYRVINSFLKNSNNNTIIDQNTWKRLKKITRGYELINPLIKAIQKTKPTFSQLYNLIVCMDSNEPIFLEQALHHYIIHLLTQKETVNKFAANNEEILSFIKNISSFNKQIYNRLTTLIQTKLKEQKVLFNITLRKGSSSSSAKCVFSPDGTKLLQAFEEELNVVSCKEPYSGFTTPGAFSIPPYAFSPDSSYAWVIKHSPQENRPLILDNKGTPRSTKISTIATLQNSQNAFFLSPHHTYCLLKDTTGETCCYYLKNLLETWNKRDQELPYEYIHKAQFFPDEQKVLLHTSNLRRFPRGTFISLIDCKTGQISLPLGQKTWGLGTQCALTPNGSKLIIYDQEQNNLLFFDTEKMSQTQASFQYPNSFHVLETSSDSKKLAIDRNNTIEIYDITRKAPKLMHTFSLKPSHVKFSPNGEKLIAINGSCSELTLYDLKKMSFIYTVTLPFKYLYDKCDVQFSPNGDFFLLTSNEGSFLYNIEEPEIIKCESYKIYPSPDWTSFVTVSPSEVRLQTIQKPSLVEALTLLKTKKEEILSWKQWAGSLIKKYAPLIGTAAAIGLIVKYRHQLYNHWKNLSVR